MNENLKNRNRQQIPDEYLRYIDSLLRADCAIVVAAWTKLSGGELITV